MSHWLRLSWQSDPIGKIFIMAIFTVICRKDKNKEDAGNGQLKIAIDNIIAIYLAWLLNTDGSLKTS